MTSNAPRMNDRLDAPLDPEETWSRDQLEAHQLEQLRWTLHHAYENVPMYRRKFDEAGVHPNDLHELSDLARFPFTTKEDLRQNYPFGMFAVPREKVARVHASSGTTGLPTVVGYTSGDLERWATVVARCLRVSGVRPGDLVQNSYGYGLFTGGLGLHNGIEHLGATAVPMSGGQTEKQIQLIQDFKPSAICSTPSYLLTILDAMRDDGVDPQATSLTHAILGAEPWTEAVRTEIEESFGLKASNIYGLSEVMGPGLAGESAEHQEGPTIWEDHFLPEIVDPFDLDTVLPDGEEGELVFTSLTKEAMPVIRYRTKDLSKLLPGDARPAHRRMSGIHGRTDDMIILRGVNLFPSQIEELILAEPELSAHFRLELTRPGRMDQLECIVERRADAILESALLAGERLHRAIKNRIGSTVKVTVIDPHGVERSLGKARRLFDMRKL